MRPNSLGARRSEPEPEKESSAYSEAFSDDASDVSWRELASAVTDTSVDAEVSVGADTSVGAEISVDAEGVDAEGSLSIGAAAPVRLSAAGMPSVSCPAHHTTAKHDPFTKNLRNSRKDAQKISKSCLGNSGLQVFEG